MREINEIIRKKKEWTVDKYERTKEKKKEHGNEKEAMRRL